MIYNGKVVGKEASVGIHSGASEEVSNVQVKCRALFGRLNPNGFTPELDEECYKALVHSKYRIRPEYTGEGSPAKAESFGKYCGLFIRARVELWLKYNRFYDVPILNRAAELIENHYSNMEVGFFWRGFDSVFSLDIENIDVDFIDSYAKTIFGKLLLHHCINLYEDWSQEVEQVSDMLYDTLLELEGAEGYEEVEEDVEITLSNNTRKILGIPVNHSDDVEEDSFGIEPWLDYGDEDEDDEDCLEF